MQIYSYNNKEMFLPNPHTYSNISSLNSHFKYYSTYYNDSSSLQTSNLSTIPYSTNQPFPKHKPKIKTTFQRTHPKPFKHTHIIQSNPNKPHIHLTKPSRNKTNFLLANYKTALSTNANWITSNPSLTHTTIPESDGKYITKTDMTINNLLQKSKYNSQYNYYKDSPSQTDTINVDEYCSFMHLLENKPKVRQLSKGIMTLLSTHNNTNNTFKNDHNEPETQRLHQLIIHNYYFEDVLNSLLRRIEYYTTNNQFISEDLVMNMLYEEAEKLKKKTDVQMEKYCHIKNFSSTIVVDNKRLQLLPLINSLNAKFYKGPHKHKEIYTTQLDKENDNEHGDINARLERLNEKKRTVTIKKRVKKMIMNEDGEMVEGDSYETVIEEIEIDDNGNGTNENWFNNIGKVSYWQEFNKHQNELIAQGIIETNNRIKARMKGLVGKDVNNTKDENGYVISSNNMFNGGKGYIEYKDGSDGRKWIIDNNNNGSSGINNSKGNMVNQYVQSNELFSIGKGDIRFGGGFGKGGGGGKGIGIGLGMGMGSGDNGSMKGELSMLFKKYDNYKPSNGGNNNKSIVNNNRNNKGEEKGKSELGDNKNKRDVNDNNNNEIIDSDDSDDDEDKEEIVNKISPANKNNKRVKSLDKVKNKINSKKKRKNKSRSNKKKKNKQSGQDKETINQYNSNEGINDNYNYTQTNMNNKTNQQEQQKYSTQYNNSYNKTNPNQQTKHIIDSLNTNTLNTEREVENNNNIITIETFNTDNNATTTQPNQPTRYNISSIKFTSGQTSKNPNHNEISNNQATTSQPEPSASPTKSKQKGRKTKHRKKNKKSKKQPPIEQPPSTFKVPYEPLPPAPSDLPNQSHIKPRPKYRSETVPTFTHPLHEELLDISDQNDPNKSNIILPGEPGADDKYDDISSSLFYIDNSRRSTLKGPKLTTDKPKSKKLLTLMPRKDGNIGNYFLRLKEEEKIQRRNDYLYKERQRRLAEEKRKRLLGRLSNSHDTAFRHLVSFEAKLKDLNLVEKIKHQLFTETTEEGKQRFLDMLNQINKLKDIDVNQYVQDLEKELDPIQEEIDAIIKAKLIEERLNKFVNTFSDFRKKQINKRCVLSDNFKVIDNKFKTTMSDKMHYALNKKSTLKNIITHYK